MGEPSPARSLTDLGRDFRQSTEELARELCDACRPMLPRGQATMLRSDHLGVVTGLEWERPVVASVMALAPAVSAAGDAVCLAAGRSDERQRVLTTAESVAALGDEALDLLPRLAGMKPGVVEFAHRVAHATHGAAGLRTEPRRLLGRLRQDRRPFTPSLWPVMAEALRRRVEQARELARGAGVGEEAEWEGRIAAAAACRDAAVHAMRAHALSAGSGAWLPAARLHRSLAFASLYCGFGVLRDLPTPVLPPGSRRRRGQRRWRPRSEGSPLSI